MTHASVIRSSATAVFAGLFFTLLAAVPAPDRQVAVGGGQLNQGGVTAVTQPGTGAGRIVPIHTWRKRASSSLVLPFDPVTGRPDWTGKLTLKFCDNLKVRADRGPSEFVAEAGTTPMPEVTQVLRSFGGTIRQAINRPVEDLVALEQRAANHSGKEQPDLASMMIVEVPEANLLDTARALNDLDAVEWVQIDRVIRLDGGNQNQSPQYGCGQNGAGDDTGQTNCYTTGLAGRCSSIGGGAGCNQPGACNQDPVGVACQYGCNNPQCCELVKDILPNCVDAAQAQGWDALCATYANIYCNGNVYGGAPPTAGGQTAPNAFYRFDPCFALRGPVDIAETQIPIQGTVVDLTTAGPGGLGITPTVTTQLMSYTTDDAGNVAVDSLQFVVYPTNASSDEADPTVAAQALPDPSLEGAFVALSAGCFADHSFGGCSQPSCCVYVCRLDPSCCNVAWDAACVGAALAATDLPVAPCTAQQLPTGVFAPAATPSPLVTGGLETNGNARGYQVYTVRPPVLGPADVLPAGVGPNAFQIAAPSVRVDVDNLGNRDATDNNLGTLQFLNGGYRGGGYDLARFELLASQLGIDPTKCRGNDITVAVVEFGVYADHEDLKDNLTPEPNQTMLLINEPPLDSNHGTAVSGIIGAVDNGFGVTGIAHECKLRFYPIVSREEGQRLLNALANAIIDLEPGDIINMSIGSGGGATVPSQEGPFLLISVATSAGITTICSAGNDAAPVRTVPEDVPEGVTTSGAIIVGACWPGFQCGNLTPNSSAPGPYPGGAYCRMNFSNFTDPDADIGGQVDVCAWGTSMTTCGYGDLFTGDNASADPLQVDKLRTYTSLFNGTSSAAPMVSGLAARVQSFAKQYFGVPLTPGQLLGCLQWQAYLQCSLDYGNPNFPGYPDGGDPRAGDLVPIGNGGQLAAIGAFPNAPATIAYAVSNTYGGAPVTPTVITGNLLGGNQFAVRQPDGTYLKVQAVRKNAGSSGNGYGPPLLYPLSGATTDVQVQLLSVQPPNLVNTLAVNTLGAITANVPVVQIIYMYNHNQNRWKSCGWGSLSPAFAQNGGIPPGDVRDYVRAGSTGGSVIYARVYTCGLAVGPYTVYHDLITIAVNVDLQNPG